MVQNYKALFSPKRPSWCINFSRSLNASCSPSPFCGKVPLKGILIIVLVRCPSPYPADCVSCLVHGHLLLTFSAVLPSKPASSLACVMAITPPDLPVSSTLDFLIINTKSFNFLHISYSISTIYILWLDAPSRVDTGRHAHCVESLGQDGYLWAHLASTSNSPLNLLPIFHHNLSCDIFH